MKKFKFEALGEPEPRPKVNSKVKGNKAEVMAAKVVGDWIGETFRRVPTSGAYQLPVDFLCGDIFCVNQKADIIFSFEIKHYKKFIGFLDKIINQAITDARRISKLPLILLRENGDIKDTFKVYLNVARPYMELNGVQTHEPKVKDIKGFYWVESTELFKKVNYHNLKMYLK